MFAMVPSWTSQNAPAVGEGGGPICEVSRCEMDVLKAGEHGDNRQPTAASRATGCDSER
jgi:hypothetical protein